MRKLFSWFSKPKGYRFPNGIPVVLAPLLTEEDIAEIHRQLWNGREHG